MPPLPSLPCAPARPAFIDQAKAQLQCFAPWPAAHFPDADAGLIECSLQEAEGTAALRGGRIG